VGVLSRKRSMKHAKRTLAILTLALAGCQGQIAPADPTPTLSTIRLLIEPSTATLWQNLAAAYRPAHTLIAWQIDTLDWDALSGWLSKGRAPFAMTSYLPTDSMLWATPVGVDALALIVNSANPIATLSPAQLRALFTGRILSWRELGGLDMPVLPVSRSAGSTEGALFRALVLGDQPVSGAARLALSAAQLIQAVNTTPGAIGYVSMAALNVNAAGVDMTQGIRVVPLDNIMPTARTVGTGAYSLRSTVVFCGPQTPGDDAYRAFFAWVQSPAGQAIVAQHYVPLPQPLSLAIAA
jgi:hypothetical protein